MKMVLEDTVKVLVDYGMSKKKKKKDIDTGLFTLIHKSKVSEFMIKMISKRLMLLANRGQATNVIWA